MPRTTRSFCCCANDPRSLRPAGGGARPSPASSAAASPRSPAVARWRRCGRLAALAVLAACATPTATAPSGQPTGLQLQWLRVDEAMKAKRFDVAQAEARGLYAANPEPWVQVMVAAATSARGQGDDACRELAAALVGIARDPLAAGPIVVDLPEALAQGEHWAAVRAEPRYPDLLARAKAARWRPEPLAFDDGPAATTAAAPRTPRRARAEPALRTLREAYALDAVVAGAANDLDRVKRTCTWVHGRTRHDGWLGDMPDDAKGLLDAAAKGGQWRCVEFGIVVAECLQAVGVPARTVRGRARDVATMLGAAGHVFAEAWLDDRQAWVFVDAQVDLVAVDRDGAPLHTAALRNALARPQSPQSYPLQLAMCLHHLTYTAVGDAGRAAEVMLAPVGTPMPTRFQRQPVRAPDVFTHRLADFYAPPRDGTAQHSRH